MKKADKRQPQSFIEAAENFERSKVEEIKKSRRVAWIVASVSMGITTVSIIAFLVALLIRPVPDPIIIQVDNATGATTMLRSLKDEQDKYDEVVDKYWLANYIRIREGYDWYTIGEQFEAVKLMSEADIASEYSRLVQAPNAPLTVLKDRAKIVAKINTITFVGNIAQVHFTTEKQSMSGENTDGSPTQKWIATVAYHFKAGVMTEQQRYVNPLGFRVVSYRADPEVLK